MVGALPPNQVIPDGHVIVGAVDPVENCIIYSSATLDDAANIHTTEPVTVPKL